MWGIIQQKYRYHLKEPNRHSGTREFNELFKKKIKTFNNILNQVEERIPELEYINIFF